MAYVNVKEWSPDQVTDWLRGLDNAILPYINSFLNNEVRGLQLLNLRSDDLEHLGIYKLGHQELILEAVDQLRNFHYELDRENLQILALRLSCTAHSLYNELYSVEDTNKIETQTMSDVANIITSIKPLVCWLDRAPFSGQSEYFDRKTKLLQLSLEMATSAQRDRFAEQPVEKIRSSCYALAQLADNIIQVISDPILLQPASLDLATLKKKDNELGFYLMPSCHGVHQITEIKFTSPAHTSNKLEEGDEIVQINYQTVVGWQRKKVLELFEESPPDIVLTLKKRPRHTKVYGQIYMKPYRLPSKKRATPYSRWNDNLPSPRPELLTIPDFEMPLPKLPPVTQPQPLESESSSDSEPPDSPLESQRRVYPLKPRPVLQRRNTVTGASPTSKRPLQAIEQYWNELKHQAAYKHSSSTFIESDNYKQDLVYLRDKSASCGHGLELTQRPATYPKKFDKTFLNGTSKSDVTKKKVNFDETKIIFEEKPSVTLLKTDILKESNFTSNPVNLKQNDSLAEPSLGKSEKSVSVNSLTSLTQIDEPIKFIDETVDELNDRSYMTPKWKNDIIEELIGSLKNSCSDVTNTTPEIFPEKSITTKSIQMLPIASSRCKKPPEIPIKPKPEVSKKPAVPPRNFTTRVTRGRLDKSHSTPAYDITPDVENKIPLDGRKTPEIFVTSPETNHSEINALDPVTNEDKCYDIDLTKIKEFKRSDTPPEPPPRTIFSETTAKIKHFEPKIVSTPVSKTSDVELPFVDNQKCTDGVKVNSEIKISPTNSVVRAMMNKNKISKKKTSVIAKRRNVTVKDLMPCDIQGYLYQRLRNKHTQNFHWEKRWFVLLGNCLYGFKSKDATKAECLIFLTGFTVAVAHEVKSRLNAFKVYHTGTAFYFSAENSETMTSWVELISAATLHSDGTKSNDSALFSETDDSESEKPKPESKEKSEPSRKFGSLKKFTSKKSSDTTTQSESTSLDRKYLKFFNNSGSKTPKNHLPVPTPQFRSYRKVVPRALVINQPTVVVSKKVDSPKLQENHNNSSNSGPEMKLLKPKPKPINYIHASNPSLCDISDYNFHNFYQKTRQFTQRTENLAGFVTLEQFMLNRQEEERQQNLIFGRNEDVPINPNSIQPDVVYGEVRSLYKPNQTHTRNHSDGLQQRSIAKDDQCKSLPRTCATDNKPEMVPEVKITEPYESQYADKKSLRMQDRSYEMIYCSQKTKDVQFAQNRTLDAQKKPERKLSKLVRQHSLNTADNKESKVFNRGESPEKFWLDSLRRNDKVADRTSVKVKLKPATQYTPMSLPLGSDQKGKLNPKFAFELNLDEKSGKGGKFKHFFGKSDDRKEKTLLGSPRLHRALFRKQSAPEADWSSEVPQVVPFSTNLTPPNPRLSTYPSNISPPPDYPGLEYPPVFEPETYSLANPPGNLTLLKKKPK